jgi:hypothetical protein
MNHVRYLSKQSENHGVIDDVQNFRDPLVRYRSVEEMALEDSISIQFWARYACIFDFSYSVKGFHFESEKWQALQLLLNHCGKIYAFEDVCCVCDRPVKLSFDTEGSLHSDIEPAVIFSDKSQLHIHHGVEIDKNTGVLF